MLLIIFSELFVHYSIWYLQIPPNAVMHKKVKHFNEKKSPNAAVHKFLVLDWMLVFINPVLQLIRFNTDILD